ncbi:MAG: diguanylate cyclase [Oscillospiraceae bacterium]|jgi:diguanylate cyclase (GGDEF)-like protein|nr:diguanylate cyclase [Oscillospiraceae bacterium]
MKKIGIRIKVMASVILLSLFCGISVLISSMYFYDTRLSTSMSERIDNSKSVVEIEIENISVTTRASATRLTDNLDFIEAFFEHDYNTLVEIMLAEKQLSGLDYGIVVDVEGNVLLRTHDIDNVGDNLSDQSEINTALAGETVTAITPGALEPLRISTSMPITDDEGNVFGMISIGYSMNQRQFALSLQESAGSEITIFEGSTSISSTLRFPALSNAGTATQNEILEIVMNGGTYEGQLSFIDTTIFSRITPIYDNNFNIVGMMLVGVSSAEAESQMFFFLLRGALIILTVLIISIIVSHLTCKGIENRLDTMIESIAKRDTLLEAVNEASIILLEIDEEEEIREPIIAGLEFLGKSLEVDRVHLWQSKEDEKEITFTREYSWLNDYAKHRSNIPKKIRASNEKDAQDLMAVFRSGDVVSGTITEMPSNYREILKPLSAKSMTIIPVFMDGQLWGLFSIDSLMQDQIITEEEITILRSVSLMMANVVKRYLMKIENKKVYLDGLTGIYNRRYFDETMVKVIGSLARAGGELSVMMIDIDYFKKYNDTYGHDAGDVCLIKIAEVLSKCVMRTEDFVARYGGEEFVVVLPNTDEAGAIAIAEKIIESIHASNIEHKASEVSTHITASIGVATGKVTEFSAADPFIKRADEMLYKSKQNGRDQYTFSAIEFD